MQDLRIAKKNNEDNKVLWITVANVFACIGVVILHCNSVFWTFPQGRTWYSANFLETFFYWPVPVFFMITGTTLIDYRKRYDTKTFFKKRVERTFIPFLIWSVIWMLIRHFGQGWKIGGVKGAIEGIFNTSYNGVYWFFIPLFAIYLSMPLISAVRDNLRKSVYIYVCVATFILTSIIPTVCTLIGVKYNEGLHLAVSDTGGYVMLVLLGYLISHNDISKRMRIVSYLLAVFGWAIQFFGTTALSIPQGEIVRVLKGYGNFPAVMQGVGVFVAFKYISWEHIFNWGGATSTFWNGKGYIWRLSDSLFSNSIDSLGFSL